MADDTTRKITLSVPVRPYGEEVREITMRRPTVKELRQCGQPYKVSNGIQADYEACARLLTLVCDPPLPSATVDTLDPGDFDEMAMTLVGFTKPARPGASEAGSPSIN